MAAINSIHRNLKMEDDANRRNIEAHEAEMHGENYKPPEKPGSAEEMEIMAAGPVTFNYNTPAPPQPPQPMPQLAVLPPTPTPAAPTSTLGDFAKKAAVIAGLASGAVTLPMAAYMGLSGDDSKPAVSVSQPESDLGLLPPDAETAKP